MSRKYLIGAGLVTATLLLAAGPVAAHGVGGRVDLPLPVWQLAWAAGFAVAVSFMALGAFWKTPRLAAAATGDALPNFTQRIAELAEPILKILGLALFGVILVGSWWGNTNPALNIAPQAVYIWFWVGIQFASMLFGNFATALNPFYTIADIAARIRSKVAGTPMSLCPETPSSEWPAVLAITSFLWVELAYHASASPRSLGLFLSLYSIVMLGGAATWGRAWVRRADGFGVLFTKLAAMSPLYRGSDGRLRTRTPMSGLATMRMVPGSIPFVLLVLGSTSFDGFTRSSIWRDAITNRTGWNLTIVRTLGFMAAVGVVVVAFQLAVLAISRITRTSTREVLANFGPSLIPIVGAYSLAHYFSFLFIDGQIIVRLISDPFGRGWDLFGTVGYRIRYTAISPRQIAWIQTLSIAIGHVMGVATAHDKAVDSYPRKVAVKSQYPMLAVMIAYTVLGLFILLSG